MNRVTALLLVWSVAGSVSAFAQYHLYNESCANVALSALTEKKPQACRQTVRLAPMPAAFSSVGESLLAKQDEAPENYADFDDFKNQLQRFYATDNPGETKSRDSACQWLFWSNGVMRRPYAGTLCAIARNADFIKKTAAKYGVPAEYIACAIGGDSMIVGGNPDAIANEKSGAAGPASDYILDLVQGPAIQKAEDDFTARNSGKIVAYTGSTPDEKLIEKIAVIGQSAKKKYLGVYQSASNLEFGKGVQREAAILATVYNKGVDRCNPSASREPTSNYFGLSCARLMKVYQLHLNGNPSAAACR